MSKHKTKLFLFFSIVFWNSCLHAQVNVEAVVKSTHRSDIYISVYWQNTHQLIRVPENGKFSFSIAAFEECLLAVYQEKRYPKTISINTYRSTQQAIRLNLSLTEQISDRQLEFNTAPSQRILTQRNSQQNIRFDLDDVEDRLMFGQLMSHASKDLQNFYQTGSLPPERINEESNLSEAALTKSEHRLGTEIYHLLKKKKRLEKAVFAAREMSNKNAASDLEDCQLDLAQLEREANLAEVITELSTKRLDREKLRFRRRQANAKSASVKSIRLAQQTMENNRRKFEIANLHTRNKQIDCWESNLQSELAVQIKEGKEIKLIQAKQIDISDLRYKRLMENARQLYEHHNELSKDLKGKDRVWQLAYAQKCISDQEQLRFFQAENAVRRWELLGKNQANYEQSIQKAIQNREYQREIAYQAEMAYLEHLWHLRDQPDMFDDVDSLYSQQTSLLSISDFRPRPASVEERDLNSFQKALDDQLVLSSKTDQRGKVKQIKFREAYYEIVLDAKGKKRYFKNNKPITKLTYAFETKRKFGEILNNIRYEESSKAKLFDFFRQKLN